MNLMLLAAGGHARAVVEAVRGSGHKVVAYVDPKDATWLRAERIGDDRAAEKSHPDAGIALGLGGVTPAGLEKRFALFEHYVGAGRSAPPVVHPTAIVSAGARVDAGVIVLAGAIVQPGASLHAACLVNSGAIVEHDATIGPGAHIAPGAIVLGGATVGANAMIGAGAVILPGAEVPAGQLVKVLQRFPGTDRKVGFVKIPSPPLVIAEAGVNHNGDLGRARELVAAAAAAGADIVKFQAFRADDLVAAGTGTAAYQAANTGQGDQRALLAALELSMDAFADLADLCRAQGIGFLCTAFDVDRVEALAALGMDYVKVASGELTNTPALKRFARLGRPVILSTGMASLDEVRQAVETLETAGAADIAILHCTSLYPAPPASLNLRAIATLVTEFNRPIGYSDHSLGSHASIAAIALGATLIEKHFTLDRRLPGPDHKASLEPTELADMIVALRETAAMLGDGVKRPAPGEAETAALVRRSWHAARDLPDGHCIDRADIVLKRPADGLPPSDRLIGRETARAIRADAPIRARDLAPA